MANINLLAPIIFRWEGGYSNHPSDKGGSTMMGVTINTYKVYCKKKGLKTPTVEDLKKITKETAIDVLRLLFWNPLKADSIKNQSIANLIVDNCWGSGLGYMKQVQLVLGVPADGLVGIKTLNAINTANQRELFERLKTKRASFYNNIVLANPSQKVFLRGWLNRLNDFKFSE